MTASDPRAIIRERMTDTHVPKDLRSEALQLARATLSGEMLTHATRFLTYKGRKADEIRKFIDRMTAGTR